MTARAGLPGLADHPGKSEDWCGHGEDAGMVMNGSGCARADGAAESDVLSSRWTPLPLADVLALVEERYGLSGTLDRLSSERDETFKITVANGRSYTLKIANPAENPDILRFQNDVLRHLAAAAPAVPVPRLVPDRDGEESFCLNGAGGAPRIVRLLTYLDGDLLRGMPGSIARNRNLGHALAVLGLGLRSFERRPPGGKLLWDISHSLDLAPLVRHVAPERRPFVLAALDAFARSVPGVAPGLRHQLIHNDFNPHNIVIDPADPDRIAGIIDFGDMVHAPLVNDLAVALAYHLSGEDWTALCGAIVEGYQAVAPLEPQEIALLPILVRSRLAMTVVITEWRAASRPEDKDYILRNHKSAWIGLQRLSGPAGDAFRRLLSDKSEA
ncbi:MAG: phosphotransferase [Rhodospirillaceae bacterium]|nr:phosphotransferase [Rhodospirillaceae bacterium]